MMTRCVWFLTLMVLSLAFSCNGIASQSSDDGGPAPKPAPPIPGTITVNPNIVIGPLPKVFRPSVMLTGSSDEAKMQLLELPGQLGTIRWSVGRMIERAGGHDEFLGSLDVIGAGAKRFEAKGAQMVISLEGMPKWLASRQETQLAAPYGWPIFRASPPRDFKTYEQFVYDTVRILNGTYGLKPFYEFWNEPNSRMFWVGTQKELLQTYAAFAAGARRADPAAKVGGLAVGSWKDPREGEPGGEPLLKAFIRVAGSSQPRVPIDFVSWHCFARSPEEKWEGATEIRDWLVAAGYDPELPQIVDEWNRWSTFPDWYDLSRDTHLGAAYHAASVLAMDRVGIQYQAFATLQDFNDPPPGKVFIGDFGTVTRKPMVKKASFHVMHMMSLLEDTRVDVQVPADLADVEGVGAVAATGNDKLTVLIHRYGADETGALVKSLRTDGFGRLSDLGVSSEEVVAFYVNKQPLPADTPAKSRQALERAALNASKAKFSAASEVVVKLAIPGWERPRRYRVYLVDDTHANPGIAYALSLKAKKSLGEAVAAARTMEELTPAMEGSGELPEIRLGIVAVALVVLDRN